MSNTTIGLVQSFSSFQGVTLRASTQVKVSDSCSMLMVETNVYRLTSGSYSQVSTAGLSWSASDESLTLLLLTNGSIAQLSPTSSVFRNIYNVSGNISSSTQLFSGKTPGNHSRILVAQRSASSAWLKFLVWKDSQMHALLTYSQVGFTSLPSFSVSASGTKALIAGLINGSMVVDGFSFNFTSMSYQNFSLPVDASANSTM